MMNANDDATMVTFIRWVRTNIFIFHLVFYIRSDGKHLHWHRAPSLLCDDEKHISITPSRRRIIFMRRAQSLCYGSEGLVEDLCFNF